MRWGLIGASDIAARGVVPAIRAQEGSTVVAVHSRSHARGEAYAAEHGIPRVDDRLEDLLDDDTIDAVFVSTTNERHRDEVIAAAQAGKHVLCEKPLAVSVADAQDMVEACREAGVVLATNHGRRSEAPTRMVRRLIAEGAIGRPLAARTFSAVLLAERLQTWRLGRPEAGAGVVLDILVHEADTLRFILDDEPKSIVAVTAQQGLAVGEVEDAAMGVITMAAGTMASFHCAFTVRYADTGFEVHGEWGSLILRRQPGGGDQGLVLRTAQGEQIVEVGQVENAHVVTVREFEAAALGQGSPSATGEDGVRSLAVAVGALESARSGCAVAIAAP